MRSTEEYVCMYILPVVRHERRQPLQRNADNDGNMLLMLWIHSEKTTDRNEDEASKTFITFEHFRFFTVSDFLSFPLDISILYLHPLFYNIRYLRIFPLVDFGNVEIFCSMMQEYQHISFIFSIKNGACVDSFMFPQSFQNFASQYKFNLCFCLGKFIVYFLIDFLYVILKNFFGHELLDSSRLFFTFPFGGFTNL